MPQYKIIEQDLRESIAIGHYKPGDMIPAEAELVETYGVSRVTVRKALDNLTAQGLLQRVVGVGTFVKSQMVKEKQPKLVGFTDEITQMGMTPSTRVLAFELIRVPDSLYQTLHIEKDEMVYYIQRVRYADGVPFSFETTYMSARLYPDVSQDPQRLQVPLCGGYAGAEDRLQCSYRHPHPALGGGGQAL